MRCAHDYCRASREADGETRCRFLSWRENSMLLSASAGAGADATTLHRSTPFTPGERPTHIAPRISSPAPATFDPLQGRTPEQQQRNEDTAVVVFGLFVALVTITAIYLWAVA